MSKLYSMASKRTLKNSWTSYCSNASLEFQPKLLVRFLVSIYSFGDSCSWANNRYSWNGMQKSLFPWMASLYLHSYTL